ncbi:alpha/beta fold hydrolase [Pseudofrankia sp. BMG5.37]|uniref:alpha/beta hydrolase family protein n=1 Tax=Pseudofrankia sp. BMG5.37 TaxID=3050035 RepID=UPI002895A161|nr:alpha/beta fold hydrolase [Pseudofrankia sp. BMG5.37]MDT3439061.1 alpha/beta fold hydrolase [Pseudofrankia sp. BMG5.37]
MTTHPASAAEAAEAVTGATGVTATAADTAGAGATSVASAPTRVAADDGQAPAVSAVEVGVLGGPPTPHTRLGVSVRPRPDESAPALVFLPAMGVRAGYYDRFVDALYEAGYSVVVTDLRGQGDSTAPHGRRGGGYHDRIELDLPAVTAVARDRFPKAPVFVVGHSLGGQLSLLRAACHGDEDGLAGIAVIATGTAYWRAFGRRTAYVLVGSWIIPAVTRTLGRWPGHWFGFGGRQPAALMLDWSRHSRTGRYQPTGYDRDLAELLADVSLPVLALSLEADPLAPRRAVDALIDRLTGTTVTKAHLTRADGLGRVGHFAWAREPAVVADHVASWVQDQAAKPE